MSIINQRSSHSARVPRRAFLWRRIIPCVAAIVVLAGCSSSSDPEEVDVDLGDTSMFPDEVLPLLEGMPEELVQALAQVRMSGSGTLVWKDAGGSMHDGIRESYLDDWAAITGWEIVDSSPSASPGEVRAQVESGNPEWDVIEMGNIAAITSLEEADLLEPFSDQLLDHLESVIPEGYEYTDTRIQYTALSHPVVWNTEVWPADGDHPSTPDDLFDTATYPGVRCLYGRPEVSPGTLEYALMADGVAFDDLYPLDIDRALAKLDTIGDQSVFWMSGAESIQFVLDGNCDLGWSWNGRVGETLRADPDASLGFSTQNALISAAYLAIPRGAPNAFAAETALAYGFTAQNQCEFLNSVGYGVPIDETCLSDEALAAAVTAEVIEGSVGVVDNSIQDLEAVVDEFSGWLAR